MTALLSLIGGIEDHVHVLCKLSKTRSMSSVIEDVKKKLRSGLRIKDKGIEYKDFYWLTKERLFALLRMKKVYLLEI